MKVWNKKQTLGICHICKQNRVLTEEHIPPKSTFNNGTVKTYRFIDLISSNGYPWEVDGIKYKLQQGGARYYTLCEQCNNLCGVRYVPEYKKIVQGISQTIFRCFDSKSGFAGITFELTRIHPLRFIKQVISMFYSINTEKFTLAGIDIKKLIHDKNYNIVDKKKIRISTYLNLTIKGSQCLGFTVIGRGNPIEITTACEIKAFPLSFVLEIDPKDVCRAADITSFFDYTFDQECDVTLSLPVKETNTMFPLDYRTKEQIVSTKDENDLSSCQE